VTVATVKEATLVEERGEKGLPQTHRPRRAGPSLSLARGCSSVGKVRKEEGSNSALRWPKQNADDDASGKFDERLVSASARQRSQSSWLGRVLAAGHVPRAWFLSSVADSVLPSDWDS
jgi:hypothetical protein